jgi:hypothetical protein
MRLPSTLLGSLPEPMKMPSDSLPLITLRAPADVPPTVFPEELPTMATAAPTPLPLPKLLVPVLSVPM